MRYLVSRRLQRFITTETSKSGGVGLVSFGSSMQSYLVTGVDSQTLTRLRRHCKERRVKYISNQEGDFLVDLDKGDNVEKESIEEILAEGGIQIEQMNVTDHVP